MKLENYIQLSSDERLQYFLSTLSVTNRTPGYYVNWNKVRRETKEFELELNTLNYLIGKDNIYEETFNLFSKQPDLLRAVPSLIASRDKVLDILSLDEDDNMSFHQLDYLGFLEGSKATSVAVKHYIAQNIFINYVGKAAEVVLFLLVTMTIVEILNNNGCFDFLIKFDCSRI